MIREMQEKEEREKETRIYNLLKKKKQIGNDLASDIIDEEDSEDDEEYYKSLPMFKSFVARGNSVSPTKLGLRS